MKLMLLEPPKGFWFIMGQYVPHPFDLLLLTIYLVIFITVPLLTFLVGGTVDRALALPFFPPSPWNLLVGLSVFLFGLWLSLKSILLLNEMGGDLLWGEARSEDRTKLVTGGVCAYTCNPMIIGYSFLPVGIGITFLSPGMTAPFLFPHSGSLIRALSSPLNGRRAQLLFISISLAGLTILTRLPFIDGIPPISLPFQKEVTGTLFIAVYILGLVAAVSPRSLRGLGHGSSSSGMVGHHPDCERFRDHVVWFNGHPFCAGCSGLALGALMGIIGSVLYFFLGVPLFMPELVFWLGVVSVALGLIQHFIDLDSPHVHLLLIVALVCGSFMLASSLNAMGASFYVEAYLLGLVIFWVATRIRVSQEEHLLVCSACSEECDRGFRTTY